jgi:hypothetical protein
MATSDVAQYRAAFNKGYSDYPNWNPDVNYNESEFYHYGDGFKEAEIDSELEQSIDNKERN